MRSREILDIISIANTFHTTPSNILGICEDEVYVRYCVDEACTYVFSMMQPDKDGNVKQPIFPEDRINGKTSKNEGLDILLGL